MHPDVFHFLCVYVFVFVLESVYMYEPCYPDVFHFLSVYVCVRERECVCVQTLNTMLSEGRLQHSLLPSFTLDQVVQAHELVEAGQSIGNVVLSMAH